MSRARLEVAANSVASALAAEAGGAARVELCTALELGGLTPSHGTIALARERLRIPIRVLIRPRAGGFVYSDDECEVMRRDIEVCRELDVAGVVLGVLTADGKIDVARCRTLIDAAHGLPVTFHRAFDRTRDPERALETVIALGCDHLLTSGQQPNARLGAGLIRRLVERAGARIVVMPGAGIHAGNLAALAAATGAREFHASAKAPVATRASEGAPALVGLSEARWETDPARVRACVEVLRTLG